MISAPLVIVLTAAAFAVAGGLAIGALFVSALDVADRPYRW